MTFSDTQRLTAQDIQAIEQRAHAMRSEALAQIVRSAGTAIASATGKALRKISGLFQRPRHA